MWVNDPSFDLEQATARIGRPSRIRFGFPPEIGIVPLAVMRRIARCVLPEALRSRLSGRKSGPTRARRESNRWLRENCRSVRGNVLSIGSGNDRDGEGDSYRNYFAEAASYTTSEITGDFGCDLVIDVRSVPGIEDETYDCVFCSGVLEHVDDFHAGIREITRILKRGGTLLLGLPFRQAIHMRPQDFWRFTEFGIRRLLEDSYEIVAIEPIDPADGADFPASYWVRGVKKPAG